MQIASEKALEFDTIRLLLAQCTVSPMGHSLAEAVEPSEEAEAVRLEQARVSLVRRSREEGCELGFEALSTLEPSTTNLKGEKPILEPPQLYALAASLQEASANRQLLESEAERLPGLTLLAEDLEIDEWIAEEITSAIDPGGKLLDDASPALRELRQALRSIREAIHKELERFFDEQDYRNYVQDEFITIRGGRLVIPIKIEHRSRHRGIVHDRSRSGDSLFFEPIEAVEQNNKLAELQAEVELEEARILARLTSVLYENWDDVVRVLKAAAYLDLLTAKARFAELYEGVEPTVGNGSPLEITVEGMEWDKVYLMSVNDYNFPSAMPQDTFISEPWYVRDSLNLEAEVLAQLKALYENPDFFIYDEGLPTQYARHEYAAERLRLFYVGITRARKELVVTWNTGRRGTAQPSVPFIALQTWWESEER